MKYMGSKRWMLTNGLGLILDEQSKSADRFVDLFSGTAAVTWHVAERSPVETLAVDLQAYSAVLARAVACRTRHLDGSRIASDWIARANGMHGTEASAEYRWPRDATAIEARDVFAARRQCAESSGLITGAYGGYYLSPSQAGNADALLQALPVREPARSLCLATLIWSLPRCVSAPGHTAQPFQPTETALPFIREAWSRDLFEVCAQVLPSIAERFAQIKGRAMVGDALSIAASEVQSDDLVFLDPPYSAGQYSRFYHVLETVARGWSGPVSGEGRYPPKQERPRSDFSLRGGATVALSELISILGQARCRVIMTFPQYECSNGISGERIITQAREWFEVDVKRVRITHSTLGGNNTSRSSQRSAMELILLMRPKRSKFSAGLSASNGASTSFRNR